LVSAKLTLARDFVGIDVDQLHHPVAVRPLVEAIRFTTGVPRITIRGEADSVPVSSSQR
jgi:hypothetical protein